MQFQQSSHYGHHVGVMASTTVNAKHHMPCSQHNVHINTIESSVQYLLTAVSK